MKEFLRHLFIPRDSNNYRARILHSTYLLGIIFIFFFASLLLISFKKQYPSVLGLTANVTADELLKLTNDKRHQYGLPPLIFDEKLILAARLKAKDMFLKNYWAHNSPDGTTPWFFIEQAGYKYMYAGENLARGFTSSQDVMKAWMNSPTHRDNIISQNYNEVGFAIESGSLTGETTILVVEMFGNKTVSVLSKQTSSSYSVKGQKLDRVQQKPRIDSAFISRDTTILFILFFISLFIIDMIIIERKKIIRLVGHNLDHLIFLSFILLFILLLHRGAIF